MTVKIYCCSASWACIFIQNKNSLIFFFIIDNVYVWSQKTTWIVMVGRDKIFHKALRFIFHLITLNQTNVHIFILLCFYNKFCKISKCNNLVTAYEFTCNLHVSYRFKNIVHTCCYNTMSYTYSTITLNILLKVQNS